MATERKGSRYAPLRCSSSEKVNTKGRLLNCPMRKREGVGRRLAILAHWVTDGGVLAQEAKTSLVNLERLITCHYSMIVDER